MRTTSIIAQLRTTDLERAVRFYTETLGFELLFRYQDFYAGIGAGGRSFHVKRVDRGARLLKEAHDTPWGTRELALRDPDGHTLYFGQPLK